jgi:hypothetical protein
LAATYILVTSRHEQTFKEGGVDAELYSVRFFLRLFECLALESAAFG